MIVILDYGLSNVGSVKNMLSKLGAQVTATLDTNSILDADAIIIPGVGSFDAGMERLQKIEGYPELNFVALKKKIPVLGICLGMQMMTRSSEEGHMKGLGWVNAETVKIDSNNRLVPNMGWRFVNPVGEETLFSQRNNKDKFYFVHSFHVRCDDQKDVISTIDYGGNIVASFMDENLVGAQFHPEKSHMYGFAFFKKWLNHFNL